MDRELAAIGERLSAIQETIDNYIKSKKQERERKRERENVPVNIFGTVGLPEAIETKRNTDQERYHTTQKLIAVAAWAAFLAASVYAAIAACQLSEMRKATIATQDAATAAKNSADLARKNAHFDQRAWLSISYGTYKYVVNEPFGTTYEITDTGRTPARNVHGKAVTLFMKIGDVPQFTSAHGTTADLGTMLPNVHQPAVSWLIPTNAPREKSIQPLKISNEVIGTLKTGSGYMMIYGTINYDSVFGAHHWIKFCATSGPTHTAEPKECVDYNDVDDNDEP